jgi:hypothetical protein
MGILRCSRPDCDNIMCDTNIPNIGYVCYECKKEFRILASTKPHLTGESNLLSALAIFMSTPKITTYVSNGGEIDNLFSKYSR